LNSKFSSYRLAISIRVENTQIEGTCCKASSKATTRAAFGLDRYQPLSTPPVPPSLMFQVLDEAVVCPSGVGASPSCLRAKTHNAGRLSPGRLADRTRGCGLAKLLGQAGAGARIHTKGAVFLARPPAAGSLSGSESSSWAFRCAASTPFGALTRPRRARRILDGQGQPPTISCHSVDPKRLIASQGTPAQELFRSLSPEQSSHGRSPLYAA
jgi:hypothetical protein